VTGIYLTNEARTAIGLKKADNEDTTALASAEITKSQEKAKLDASSGSHKNPNQMESCTGSTLWSI
jgi:hypothetical protein